MTLTTAYHLRALLELLTLAIESGNYDEHGIAELSATVSHCAKLVEKEVCIQSS
jgi:hypothetical protein